MDGFNASPPPGFGTAIDGDSEAGWMSSRFDPANTPKNYDHNGAATARRSTQKTETADGTQKIVADQGDLCARHLKMAWFRHRKSCTTIAGDVTTVARRRLSQRD